jgi:hypothetical protein
MGLLLVVTGLGHWSRGPDALPGSDRASWLPLGLALGLCTLVAIRAAAVFEHSPSLDQDLLLIGVLTASLCTALASYGLVDMARGRLRLVFPAAVLWFALVSPSAAEWFTVAWLPLGLAVMLGSRARRNTGQHRALAAAGALLAAGCAAAGWPEVPAAPSAAISAVVAPVVLLWWAGSLGVMEAR